MSIEKLKKIIYLSRASGIFLPKKSNKSPQSSAVTSKMSYINFRLRNYEINKAVNKLNPRTVWLHIRQSSNGGWLETFLIYGTRSF